MENKTKDVETLLGNPKKAMISMSVPIIVATFVQNANNLIDSIWVAGLGSNALAAVGIVFPIFFIMISIGNGIGIGSSSAIARFLGMDDKESASRTASQAVVLGFAGSMMLSVILLIFEEPIFVGLGAGDAFDECIQYATPIFITFPIAILNGIICNLLRSEGASRRSMYSQVLAAVINIILDPLFIYDYGLGWGLAGAAIATAISMLFSLALLSYWYWIRKSTFLKISFRKFRFDWNLDKAIFRVGFPASIEMIVISVSAMVLNSIVISVAGTNGVAIYSSAWKIIQFMMIPLMGMGSAIVPVCAAAFGMRKYENIRIAYRYSIKVITIIMGIIIVLVLLFADQVVFIFTYSDATSVLREDMAYGIRVCCAFIIFIPWGFVTAGMFQALGMGTKSLISSMFRNFLAIPLCAIIATDMTTFWTGVIISEIVGTLVIGIWGLIILKYLMQGKYHPSELAKDARA